VFQDKDIDPHKEEQSFGLPEALGVNIRKRRPYVIRINPTKMRLLRAATRHAVRARVVRPKEIECIMGSWAWALQVARAGYSVPQVLYAFLHAGMKPSVPVPLWREAARELWTLLLISPFLKTSLEAVWLGLAFMLDSSNMGFGIIHSVVTREALRL